VGMQLGHCNPMDMGAARRQKRTSFVCLTNKKAAPWTAMCSTDTPTFTKAYAPYLICPSHAPSKSPS
jgi:hypothetical protein